MHLAKLGEFAIAIFSRQPNFVSDAKSISLDVYAGPTRRPEPARGVMSSRTAARRDAATRASTLSFASAIESGLAGIALRFTAKNWAKRSASASNHDSTYRTTTRRRMCWLGAGNQSEASAPAHICS